MNNHILDILALIMKEIQQSESEDLDLQLIIDILSEQGFSDDDISTAITWIMNNQNHIDRMIQGSPAGIPRPIWRHLNAGESNAISPRAYSYLFHLRELQLLSDDDMERIIERAVTLHISQIDIEDIQDLIAAVVLDFESSASDGYFQFTTTNLPH
jgi:uncharacterized protein Smg (DUF494 family)